MSAENDAAKVLGLAATIVRLCDHTPVWGQLYIEEELRISEALRGQCLDIQHVGSTFVPGLKAKPIIDILVGVRDLKTGLSLVEPLSQIEYTYLGDTLVPNHLVFGKGLQRSYLLHVVQHLSDAWTRVIAFRDILRSKPSIASRYEVLKVLLSKQYHNDRTGYGEAKTVFIDAVLANGDWS